MSLKTALYEQHAALGAKLVDFAGWQMPLNYGSQIDEHMAVREQAGIFDVSHMTLIDLEGKDVVPFLRYLLANDINRLKQPGKAIYSCMLNEAGGVIDDLIVYWLAENQYRIVSNAATHDTDLAWIQQQAAQFDVSVTENQDMSIIACQGAKAIEWAQAVLPPALAEQVAELKPFSVITDNGWLLATTGYTGEAGFELMVPNTAVVEFWRAALAKGFKPVGLAARDTLRLEAGLNLYGADMDTTTSPLVSNLAWTVSWHDDSRDFIGKSALKSQMQIGVKQQLIGLILQAPGVLRGHQKVYQNNQLVGETTSGTYSPYLKKAIALARVAVDDYCDLTVAIRGKQLPVLAVKPCFVRLGKPQITELNKPLEKETNHD